MACASSLNLERLSVMPVTAALAVSLRYVAKEGSLMKTLLLCVALAYTTVVGTAIVLTVAPQSGFADWLLRLIA
jgi:Na+-transporting NADH:ubiquinone oxidoreductase subunit NqrD